MPAPRLRSTSVRKVHVKTPGGRTTLHYRRKKPSKAICSSCKKELAGVPRERPHKMRTMAKTKKRPERPYGGTLCSKCTRREITSKARQ